MRSSDNDCIIQSIDGNKALIEKFLGGIPIFKRISEKYIDQIVHDMKIVQCKKEGPVFHQSDKTMDLYIVLEGKVKASLIDYDGKELILATFKQGEFFGEMSMLDGIPRSATVIAEEDATLGVLKRETFLMAIKQNPMIAIDLIALLVKKLRETDALVESLTFFDVDDRLIRLLLEIAKVQGEKVENGYYKIRKLTHKELAARIGSSRVALSKAMKNLNIRKKVVEENGYLLIHPDIEDLLSKTH